MHWNCTASRPAGFVQAALSVAGLLRSGMWCSWIGNAGGCSRAESAVDVEHGSGDVGGVRAREERDAGGHLLGTRVTTQRGGRGSGRGELAVGRVHLGVD